MTETPELTSLPISPAEAAAMLRAVFTLFTLWDVSDAEGRMLLGEPSASMYERWKSGDVYAVSHDTVFRMADLIGVHGALRYMFADPSQGHAWLRKPNLAFGGRSALDRMLAGAPSDITSVRACLDAERNAW